jgi:hypothetical protein
MKRKATSSHSKVLPVTYKREQDTLHDLIGDKDDVRPASSVSAVSYEQTSESESRIGTSLISLRQRTQFDRDLSIISSVSLPGLNSTSRQSTLNERESMNITYLGLYDDK